MKERRNPLHTYREEQAPLNALGFTCESQHAQALVAAPNGSFVANSAEIVEFLYRGRSTGSRNEGIVSHFLLVYRCSVESCCKPNYDSLGKGGCCAWHHCK